MVYLKHDIEWRYTILVRNPQHEAVESLPVLSAAAAAVAVVSSAGQPPAVWHSMIPSQPLLPLAPACD